MRLSDMGENFFNETEYIDGFNLGYKIAQEFPELAEIIGQAKSKSDRFDGLKDGRQQFLEEQLKEKAIEQDKNHDTPAWLKDDRMGNLDKGFDKPKSKDIEPDL
ncbi:hypothetical protein [Pedobacter sp. KACC 23697]|uniref:Uncharacterized protein n=1 Tax=Pedobacter sp. KACC 23697 TaxID=3149230 RepID=A0AAU7K636_9SPHI